MADIDIDLFIELVSTTKCLWDTSSKQYKNKVLKNRIWTRIGEECGKSGIN